MAEEKKWGKWDGPEKPVGPGAVGMAEPTPAGEAEGHSRQMVAICSNCGAHSYVGGDWKWFTCWKCGAMSSDVAVA